MRCCICGDNIENMGNNPYPLCEYDDMSSRCCDSCNDKVIQARIISMKCKNKLIKQLEPGDEVLIFYTKHSDEPINALNATGKFIAGIVEDTQMSDDLDGAFVAFGTWGNYFITDEDSFICL